MGVAEGEHEYGRSAVVAMSAIRRRPSARRSRRAWKASTSSSPGSSNVSVGEINGLAVVGQEGTMFL
jgi:hypothetical protein